MSTKFGIYFNKDNDSVYLYEEACIEGTSPAYIQVGPGRFKIEHDFDDQHPEVTIEIDAEEMDRLAIAWLKHRSLLTPGAAKGILKDVCPLSEMSDNDSRDSALD